MRETFAVKEVDVSQRGYHHASGLGTHHRLCAVVNQSVGGIIDHENPILFLRLSMNDQTAEKSQNDCDAMQQISHRQGYGF